MTTVVTSKASGEAWELAREASRGGSPAEASQVAAEGSGL